MTALYIYRSVCVLCLIELVMFPLVEQHTQTVERQYSDLYNLIYYHNKNRKSLFTVITPEAFVSGNIPCIFIPLGY